MFIKTNFGNRDSERFCLPGALYLRYSFCLENNEMQSCNFKRLM